jgi:hypothetical protein
MSKESTEKTPPSAVAPKPAHAESATPHNTPGSAPGSNGAAIASLILGIFAFLFGWFFLGLLLGAGAIVFGIIGLKKPGGKGMSIAGIITGAIGALSALLFSLIWLVAILAASATVNEGESIDTNATQVDAEVQTINGESEPVQSAESKTIAELFPTRSEAEAIARANAEEDWGTDYSMVKYSYDNQMEAYDWLVQQTEHKDIMQDAIDDWGDDYEMVQYTYNNQVDAYNSLQ